MPAEQVTKVRENKLRRMAARQGYGLMKSRARDPRALGYGGFMIVDPKTNFIVAGASPGAYSLSADEVEEWLLED